MEYLEAKSLLNNRYIIDNFISKGAMGAVYCAFDTRLKCKVALKQNLLPINKITKTLFQREAELLANLKHVSLPVVYDYFVIDGLYYLVMELIEGEDLQSVINKKEVLSIEKGLYLFEKLLDVLTYIHSFGIIHLDIKPANLKIDDRDHELKLLDFGIAKGNIGLVTKDIPTSGGTPLYMSLEQTQMVESNNFKLSEKSDLYSAATTFFHLMSGSEPIPSYYRYLIWKKEGVDPQRLISNIKMDFPVPLAEAIYQGMQLLPDNRIGTSLEYKHLINKSKSLAIRQYTKWPDTKKHYVIPKSFDFPVEVGLLIAPFNNEYDETESMLYYFDNTNFINDLAGIVPFELLLKSILYDTSHGPILCLFFNIKDSKDGKSISFSSEYFVNLFNPLSLIDIKRLSKQSHWHFILIDSGKRQVVAALELDNNFDLGHTLNKAIKVTRRSPRGDFLKAKQEFMDTFSLDDLKKI